MGCQILIQTMQWFWQNCKIMKRMNKQNIKQQKDMHSDLLCFYNFVRFHFFCGNIFGTSWAADINHISCAALTRRLWAVN
uniref:Uncharacterized protein n=1 Tax=Anguilla anguilla TaxID=7936 RepID=A0A0E9PNN4_ANGAN